MIINISIAAAVLLATYLLRKLYAKRYEQFAEFPQFPPSLILGSLKTVGTFTKQQPPKAHADMAFTAMYEALGRPSVMLVDLRPVAWPMLVIGSYEVAEQVVKASDRWPQSPPKTSKVWKHLEYVTGPKSIISAGGEEWKTLRKRFNPGFSAQNLMELLPSLLQKATLFIERLDAVARSGEEFELQTYATDLTFDIIGRVVLNIDMDAQKQQPIGLMQTFRQLIFTYTEEHIDLPWWCTPRTEWKRYRLHRSLRKPLCQMIRNHHAKGLQEYDFSILSMSLRDIIVLTPELENTICDQLISFLFAGHDTTSTLISWVFYELGRTPHALNAVRAELDEIFGLEPHPTIIHAKLCDSRGKDLNRMSYTTAVIKETLRLWPPGATSRMTKPGDGFTIDTPNGQKCIDGLMIYQIHSIIQKDPKVFGDTADKFVPERWLNSTGNIPPGAWRPFERGPRNCIGQELAMIEARIVIALIARRFDFVKVGRGSLALSDTGNPEIDEHGQYKVASEMYMVNCTDAHCLVNNLLIA
jgi:cytochrome P450